MPFEFPYGPSSPEYRDSTAVPGNFPVQTRAPLESSSGAAQKEITQYGPSVPEYQETIQTRPRPSLNPHPWKVSSAGPSSVTVADGKVMGLRATNNSPWYAVAVSFAESDVFVPGAGWLYAVIDTDESLIFTDDIEVIPLTGFYLTANARTPTAVTVQFSASSPDVVAAGSAGQIWIPIAEVDIVDGAAVATEQYLTHNPVTFLETPSRG